MLDTGDQDVIAWSRHARLGETEAPDVLVIANCSARTVSVSIAGPGASKVLRTLVATYAADAAVSSHAIALPPFGVYLGEVERRPGLESQPAPILRHHH